MTWDTTQPVNDLVFKTSFKAWRHPSNTAGYLTFGGITVLSWEILPTGAWVSMERYWKAGTSATSVLSTLPITDYGSLGWTEGGYVLISDIVISQTADIVTWQRDKTSAYVVSAGDIGKRIAITTGGVNISAAFNTAVPTGSWFEVYNNSDVAQAITCAVTLRLAASGTTGQRTVAGRGLAVLNKTGSNEWLIYGAGVT